MARCTNCGHKYNMNWVRLETCPVCRGVRDVPGAKEEMTMDADAKPKLFYMGHAGIDKMFKTGQYEYMFYSTLQEAIDGVAHVVNKDASVRYIVQVVAKVEAVPPPTKVTYFNEDGKESV